MITCVLICLSMNESNLKFSLVDTRECLTCTQFPQILQFDLFIICELHQPSNFETFVGSDTTGEKHKEMSFTLSDEDKIHNNGNEGGSP